MKTVDCPRSASTVCQTLGSNAFLPSDEVSSTFQVNDDFTKIYGKHTFKMGIEWQHVKFSTLQPPWSRGQFNFDGVYTNIPGASPSSENTGSRQFLLTPALFRPWEGPIMSAAPACRTLAPAYSCPTSP